MASERDDERPAGVDEPVDDNLTWRYAELEALHRAREAAARGPVYRTSPEGLLAFAAAVETATAAVEGVLRDGGELDRLRPRSKEHDRLRAAVARATLRAAEGRLLRRVMDDSDDPGGAAEPVPPPSPVASRTD